MSTNDKNLLDVNQKVWFNVGGAIFLTTAGTLMNAGKNSTLVAMLNPSYNKKMDSEQDAYFFDRDPDMFERILSWLRTGFLRIFDELDRQRLVHECEFFCMEDMKKHAEESAALTTSTKVFPTGRGLGIPKHRM